MKPPFCPGQGIAGLLKIGSGRMTASSGERSAARSAPTAPARLGQSWALGGTLSATLVGSWPVSMKAPLVEWE